MLALGLLWGFGGHSGACPAGAVVTACGSLAPFGPQTAGGLAFPTVDTTGKLCLSGGGSGGGGIASITAGATPTTGFTAGQLLMSDGTVTQASPVKTTSGNSVAAITPVSDPGVVLNGVRLWKLYGRL